ncbi:MAG: DUF4215 domain-containing protein [Candidatus Binatia bacterium]
MKYPGNSARAVKVARHGGVLGLALVLVLVASSSSKFSRVAYAAQSCEIGFALDDAVTVGGLIWSVDYGPRTVPDPGALPAGTYDVTFVLDDAVSFGALVFEADYSDSPGGFDGQDASVNCVGLVDGVLSAFQDSEGTRTLSVGFISPTSTKGPVALVRCSFTTAGGLLEDGSQFNISVVEATDIDLNPIFPVPTVSLSSISSRPAVALSSPPGGSGFDGVGAAVDCSVDPVVSDAVFAAFDDDEAAVLTLGMISEAGILGPVALASCRYTNRSPVDLSPDGLEFSIVVEEAIGMDNVPLIPLPAVVVGGVNCEPLLCGNGLVDPGTDEQCDDAGESAACNADCTVSICGDGTLNVLSGEECDDGGESAVCDADCTVPFCGDGTLNVLFGEQCDDGGESALCDADCTMPVCGDGTLNVSSGETCDNGGESALCDADCTLSVCGDGTLNVSSGEQCDDGGESAACDADCTASICGNGTLNLSSGESCDDGGESAACNADCTVSICGDGTLNVLSGEECDDGNLEPGDGCSGLCVEERCGDGAVQVGEDCDDGNLFDGDGCSQFCAFQQLCGDVNDNGSITVTDSLLVLRRSVELDVLCPDSICDVNSDGSVTTADALIVLRRSVDLPVFLLCTYPL